MSTQSQVRVLVVDDSIMARNLIVTGLAADPRIDVVGYAVSALDAKAKIPSLKPDVISLDVEMPGMSGVEFLKELRRTSAIPAILVSSLDPSVFDALSGAVDFVRKPDESCNARSFVATLAQKIVDIAAAIDGSRPIPAPSAPTQRQAAPARCAAPASSSSAAADGDVLPSFGASAALDRVIIGLGASTGGTEATLEVLRHLPADTPGLLIVQHMPVGFTKMYAERLDRLCPMCVREAQHGDVIRRGVVLLAPAGMQMRVVHNSGHEYSVSCRPGEKVSGHCPSVDALFSSMAETVHEKMAGIILTGMGRDGANGLLAMRQRGAYTIGQDEASCVVYGMPMAAYEIGAVSVQAPCQSIAQTLAKYINSLK